MRPESFGRGPLRWRRRRSGLRYEGGGGYGAAQAVQRAQIRRGLWWATVAVVAIVLLCCAGMVVSQIGFGGSTRPAPGATASLPVVPDVVGKRLPDALKALSTAGFRNTKRNDATGQGRVVISSSSWIVQSQSPAGGSRVGHDTRIVLGVKRPSDGQGTVTAVLGEVPRVVCKDLQAAQDIMAKAGFVNVDVRDGSGRTRLRLLDRDWVVIAQSVPGGERPDRGTLIVLTAVKFGEPTGTSGCLD